MLGLGLEACGGWGAQNSPTKVTGMGFEDAAVAVCYFFKLWVWVRSDRHSDSQQV